MKAKQYEFWLGFKKSYSAEFPKLLFDKPYGQAGYDIKFKHTKKYHISSKMDTRGSVLSCEIDFPDAPEEYALFLSSKTAIESDFGEELQWIEPPEKKVRRIRSQYLRDFDISKHNELEAYFRWLADKMKKFERIFGASSSAESDAELRINLEKQFHKAMLDIYQQTSKECNYRPSLFLKMVHENGGVRAAKILLHKSDISDGFTRLYECGRLDLTVEFLAMQPEWKDIFTDEERLIADKRLADFGYKPLVNWKEAVLQAIKRYTGRHRTAKFTRQGLLQEELEKIKRDTQTGGITPEQTISKVLQDLRNENLLFFIDYDCTYLLLDTPVEVEAEELPKEALDYALENKKLAFSNIPTSNERAVGRYRKGQARIREKTLQNYRHMCALCDVKDEKFLVTSHISRWTDDPEGRGDLTNVICLCKFHDTLFEEGYLTLSDDLKVLRKEKTESNTVNLNLDIAKEFKLPLKFRPDPKYLQKHRQRVGR